MDTEPNSPDCGGNNIFDTKLKAYARTIERMHGVIGESEKDLVLQNGIKIIRNLTKSNSFCKKSKSKKNVYDGPKKISANGNETDGDGEEDEDDDEDDGIFSPTQDDEIDDEFDTNRQSNDYNTTLNTHRQDIFSETSPKQIYETSGDDWYASASDPDEISNTVPSKAYSQGAVNPVLECVNQILLQQSLEGTEESSTSTQTVIMTHSVIPRRSSLSDNKTTRVNQNDLKNGGNDIENINETQSPNINHATNNNTNNNLTRKRVHFSTKNSMVHVPRNDELDFEEDIEDDGDRDLSTGTRKVNYQEMSKYIDHTHPLSITNLPDNSESIHEDERFDALNYESIYSNEYEPIGSEMNSSNLYVDMESNNKLNPPLTETKTPLNDLYLSDEKFHILPPALPPKPANLLKFKKSLQQLKESPEELTEIAKDSEQKDMNVSIVEPDYCSISEFNVGGITSVQITADVHRPPLSESDMESFVKSDLDIEPETVHLSSSSSSTSSTLSNATSQKTEEIEEIFADIPKLPNVAAIIAPKSAIKSLKHQHNQDYLTMIPSKIDCKNTINNDTNLERKAIIKATNGHLNAGVSVDNILFNNNKNINFKRSSGSFNNQCYTQKQLNSSLPNVLIDLNKQRVSGNTKLCNGLISSTPNSVANNGEGKRCPSKKYINYYSSTIAEEEANIENDLPLQAEFDWYNLDAEYGKSQHTENHHLSTINHTKTSSILADIREDRESVLTTADEYNLDEAFENDELHEYVDHNAKENIEAYFDENPKLIKEEVNENKQQQGDRKLLNEVTCNNSLNLNINNNRANKMKTNLANFEKFIENSGLCNKPLPTKRKLYFAAPFV